MSTIDINNIVKVQRDYFDTDETHPYEFRLSQLQKLKQAIKDRKEQFADALY